MAKVLLYFVAFAWPNIQLSLPGMAPDSWAFKYEALPSATAFRLIELHGVNPDKSVECTMHMADLASHPPYEALSYTWGDPRPSKGIETAFAPPVRPDVEVSPLTRSVKAAWSKRPKMTPRQDSARRSENKHMFVRCNNCHMPVTPNLYNALKRLLSPRNVNGRDAWYSKTALHWAAEEGQEGDVENLLSQGADVSAQDSFGETPLHYGAENGHLGVVSKLVEAGALIEKLDYTGRTPHECALRREHPGIVSYLARMSESNTRPAATSGVPHSKQMMVWIDALCIDQTSLSERSSQVGIMSQIYSGAKRVIVWLGEEDDTTEQAVKDLHRITAMNLSRLEVWNDRLLWTTEATDRELNAQRIRGVLKIFHRAWFDRAWIVQEIVMAKHVMVFCGPHEIQWETMYRFCSKYRAWDWTRITFGGIVRLRAVPDLHESIGIPVLVRKAHKGEDQRVRQTLSELLKLTTKMKCTLPADKVYALLGIARLSRAAQIAFPTADYSLDVAEIYKRAALVSIVENHDLHLVLGTPRGQPASTAAKTPSWVPDLSTTTRPKPLPLWLDGFKASPAFDTPPGLSLDGLGLSVEACLIDHVERAGVPLEENTPYYLLQLIVEWTRFGLELPFHHVSGKSRSEILLHTITAGRLGDEIEQSPEIEIEELTKSLWIRCMMAIVDLARERNPDQWTSCLPYSAILSGLVYLSTPETQEHVVCWPKRDVWLYRSTWNSLAPLWTDQDSTALLNMQRQLGVHAGRKLLITRRGSAGLGPAEAQLGGEIWLIRGFYAPVLLERLENGRYKFVGEAYIQGIMQGQAYVNNDQAVFRRIELG